MVQAAKQARDRVTSRFSYAIFPCMTTHVQRNALLRPLVFAAALAVFGAVMALAFSAWLRYGPEIFLSLTDRAVNWCL